MNYTIMTLNNYKNTQKLHLDKDNDKYIVGLWSNTLNKGENKVFDKLNEAIAKFEDGVEIFAREEYSFVERCDYLFG